MNDDAKRLLRQFCDWVEGNGERPENEERPPETPPELPFTRNESQRPSRHPEVPLRVRCRDWLELHGPRLFSSLYTFLSVLLCGLLVVLLLATVAELPPFGSPDNPANNEVTKRYLEKGLEETGAQNIVAGVILDYRAFDTLGESAVLFTAAVSVLLLLKGKAPEGRALPQDEPLELRNRRNRPDLILKDVAALSIPSILILGFVVVLNGHLSPGGGFSGGAILSAALILCANAYGFALVRRFFRERTFVLSSCGALLFYAFLKGCAFFTGGNGIESGIPKGKPGAILSGGVILPLNIAVALVVAGTIYGFYALFSEGEI